jgi:hypothetical protein
MRGDIMSNGHEIHAIKEEIAQEPKPKTTLVQKVGIGMSVVGAAMFFNALYQNMVPDLTSRLQYGNDLYAAAQYAKGQAYAQTVEINPNTLAALTPAQAREFAFVQSQASAKRDLYLAMAKSFEQAKESLKADPAYQAEYDAFDHTGSLKLGGALICLGFIGVMGPEIIKAGKRKGRAEKKPSGTYQSPAMP